MCTSYAEALEVESQENGEETLFSRLVYLQRNWEYDDVFGKQPESEFLELVSSMCQAALF